ncbi:MAG: hypothetical protein Q7Q73_10210 [Verrucomicrobiota bacterium JB024]|nr:hypothetical protein [Verrucomicrobiota bacterium JB024]
MAEEPQPSAAEWTLVVEPSRALIIEAGSHRIGDFNREMYFRTYHFPGLYAEARNAELREIGALPGRGTGPSFSIPGNPLIDTEAQARVERILEQWCMYAERANRDFPGLPYAMAGSKMPKPWTAGQAVEEDDVDATMKIPNTLALDPRYYKDGAGLVSEWIDKIDETGGEAPVYYSAINEPDSGWKCSGDRIGSFIDYHLALAKVMREDHPQLKLTGPCTAWGYPTGDFSRWEDGWEGQFIDKAGNTVGAYDFHFYSKGYWAFVEEDRGWNPKLQQESPSLIASRRTGVGTVWEFGRLDAFLDMLASRHLSRWGGEPPSVIVSEFGRQGITQQLGPWENDFKHLLYMNTVVRMWMTFFQRPEVELTVPFILPESDLGYGSLRGQALYTRPGYPKDTLLVATPFVRFYKFLKDLDGVRVQSGWEGNSAPEAISTLSLRDGNRLRVLVHNGNAFGTESSLTIRIPENAKLLSADSIRWEGPLPERVDSAPEGCLVIGAAQSEPVQDGELTEFTMRGEETMILTWELDSTSPSLPPVTESWTYSPLFLQRLEPMETLVLEVPAAMKSSVGSLALVLGLAREDGFGGAVVVSDGGEWQQQIDLSSTLGVTDYHDTLSISLPDSVRDTLYISLEDGGIVSSAKWVVSR